MKKVLVLCAGNSSRSQMAEGYLQYYAHERGQFFSAGLEERAIHPLTIEIMAEDNIDISGNTSKSYRVFKGTEFDYLLTVCEESGARLPRAISAKEIIHFSIPDPEIPAGSAEESKETFRKVREIVKKHILIFIGKELTNKTEATLP